MADTNDTIKKGQSIPAQWQERFLASLRKYANVSAAAKAARVSRSFAYEQRAVDPLLAAAWQDALDEACDGLEREAWRRAAQGVRREKGVYHLGDKVATEVLTEYSDTLLIVLLKAHRPEKYRETINQRLGGPNGESLSFLGLVQAAQPEPERP